MTRPETFEEYEYRVIQQRKIRAIDNAIHYHEKEIKRLGRNIELTDQFLNSNDRILSERLDSIERIIQQNKLTAERHYEALEGNIKNLMIKNKVLEILLRGETEFYTEKVLLAIEEVNK